MYFQFAGGSFLRRRCVEFKLGSAGSKLDASPLLNFKNFTLWWCSSPLFPVVFSVVLLFQFYV